MKTATVQVLAADLRRILWRGVVTMDPQMIPQWAHSVLDDLRDSDEVTLTLRRQEQQQESSNAPH